MENEKKLGDTLIKKIINSTGENNNSPIGDFEEFAVLFALNEHDFNILKSPIIAELEKSLNNPSDKYLLLKSLEQNNVDINELIELYNTLLVEIDEQLKDISQDKRDFLKQVIGIIVNAVNEANGTANEKIHIPIELCNSEAKIPTYANVGDAGLDIYALEDVTIKPGETKLIKTGLKVAIPKGYELQVRPKSGRALKTKLRVANTPGTIDSGYRDEIGVIVENIESPIKDMEYDYDDYGNIIIKSILYGENYYITKGEKFAQLVLNKVPTAVFYEVDNIGDFEGDRGGGFGSSSIYGKNDERYGTDLL